MKKISQIISQFNAMDFSRWLGKVKKSRRAREVLTARNILAIIRDAAFIDPLMTYLANYYFDTFIGLGSQLFRQSDDIAGMPKVIDDDQLYDIIDWTTDLVNGAIYNNRPKALMSMIDAGMVNIYHVINMAKKMAQEYGNARLMTWLIQWIVKADMAKNHEHIGGIIRKVLDIILANAEFCRENIRQGCTSENCFIYFAKELFLRLCDHGEKTGQVSPELISSLPSHFSRAYIDAYLARNFANKWFENYCFIAYRDGSSSHLPAMMGLSKMAQCYLGKFEITQLTSSDVGHLLFNENALSNVVNSPFIDFKLSKPYIGLSSVSDIKHVGQFCLKVGQN